MSPVGPLSNSPGQLRLVFLAVASVLFLASLGQTVVTAALPIIVGELGGLDRIPWVITAYLLAATLGAPVFGKLGDLYGRKRVLQCGIAVFLAGSLLSAAAGSIWVLVAGRFVQGLGGGGLIVVSMATVGDVVPPRQRGRYQGVLGSVFGISTVVGPLAGGWIVEHLHWSWIFLINLPLAMLAFTVLTALLTPRPPAEGTVQRLDVAGAACLTLALSGTVIVASLGGDLLPWDSVATWAVAGAALAGLVGFIHAERHAPAPVLPLQLFRINNFVVANSVGVITGVGLFSVITFVPMFMQVAKGMSPATSGLFVVPMMGGLVVASTLAGGMMSRTGRYRMLPVCSTLLLAAALGLMSTVTAETPTPMIAVYLLFAGFGIGPVMGISVTAIQNAVPITMMGIGTASANMFRLIGGAVGTAVLGAIFAHGLTRELGGTSALPGIDPRGLTAEQIGAMNPEIAARVVDGIAAALQPVYLIAAALACLASVIALAMVELPLADRVPGTEPAPTST